MSIEKDFDVSLIAALALREKQVQQNYRPIIAVHKWFARRPGSLFRGLLLAEFGDRPLSESYFSANNFPGRVVADPFMGGGIPIIEANRVGCDVIGFDINPMATWIVREEIEHLDLEKYRTASGKFTSRLHDIIGSSYKTDCPLYGDRNVPVKYFLWVKTIGCTQCDSNIDLFPGYLVADDTRHTQNVLVCAACGQLNEVLSLEHPGRCKDCAKSLKVNGPAKRGHCACPHCGQVNHYPRPEAGPPRHRLFAIEYYNPSRRETHKGRYFKKPDTQDLARFQTVARRWRATQPTFVPTQNILPGDETDRLHRWGYQRYQELFNERQLLGLEHSCRLIAAVDDTRLRYALATNLSDLLRYQNMLCRYDTMSLKSLDIFSVHGFPVGLVHCESNLLGIANGNGVSVGSGGWSNIIEKYYKAKQYCEAPFEVRIDRKHKVVIPITGEWIGERFESARSRTVNIHCASSASVDLPPRSLDAVFTDPPYFGNVQYGELMDFCYVWLRRLVGTEAEGFHNVSSRLPGELTGNVTQARGLEHFTEGLSATYRTMARALKPGAPLAFTFHHNKIEAYHAIGVAILDAQLSCSAAIPCPAEMGGSIHIRGTGSSIVDTIFVCRNRSVVQKSHLASPNGNLEQIVRNDLSKLIKAGLKPTSGDIRCILYGHVTKTVIQALAPDWDRRLPIGDRLRLFAENAMPSGRFTDLIESLAQEFHQRRNDLAEDNMPLFNRGVPNAVSF